MRLNKEEKKALADDIMGDLPEFFALFSPHTWLWLVEIFLTILGGAMLVFALHLFFELSSPLLLYISILLITVISLGVPNLLIVSGKNTLGIKYLQIISKLHIVIASLLLFQGVPIAYLSVVVIASALLVIWITRTIRFQVFALHRKKMADWGRERIKKNKAFRQAIKDKHRQTKQ